MIIKIKKNIFYLQSKQQFISDFSLNKLNKADLIVLRAEINKIYLYKIILQL